MFRDFTGRTFGDAFGCACAPKPFAGYDVGQRNWPAAPVRAMPALPPPGPARYHGFDVAGRQYASPHNWPQPVTRPTALQPQSFRAFGAVQTYGATVSSPEDIQFAPSTPTDVKKPDWNQIASGAGTFLQSLLGGKQAQAQTQQQIPYAPQQQGYYPSMQPPAPPPTMSWVGPAVAVGGVSVIGLITYLLTR